MCPAPRSIADYRPTAAAECCYMAASRPSDAGPVGLPGGGLIRRCSHLKVIEQRAHIYTYIEPIIAYSLGCSVCVCVCLMLLNSGWILLPDILYIEEESIRHHATRFGLYIRVQHCTAQGPAADYPPPPIIISNIHTLTPAVQLLQQ